MTGKRFVSYSRSLLFMHVSIIIPTYKAKAYVAPLVEKLWAQSLKPLEIIVVDSSSNDGTVEIAQKAGCRVEVIAQSEFNHGGTRNFGARLARGDLLVFMTQDAMPTDTGFLESLAKPLQEHKAVAAYARQIAYPDAPPPEVFTREFNYPAQSHLKTLADVPKRGFKAFYYSDVASVIGREVFWSAGGYPDWVIVDEDVYLCAKLLRAGHTVAYQAEASVFHSHHYPLSRQFMRIFDVGVFVSQSAEMLEGAKVGGEGVRLVLEQAKYLAKRGEWRWIPYCVLEAATKFVAYQFGLRYRLFPTALNVRMSQQKQFWERMDRQPKVNL